MKNMTPEILGQKQKPVLLDFSTWRRLHQECLDHVDDAGKNLTLTKMVSLLIDEHIQATQRAERLARDLKNDNVEGFAHE